MSDVVELDPSDPKATMCGTCGRGWDDSISTSVTPTPAGRCPFEYDHVYEDNEDKMTDNTYIMLLNDGETFTNLDNCMVLKVPAKYADSTEDIEEFITTANSYNPDEREMFDHSIVAYFEERKNNFRFVTYVPK
jgi:hypothetical protein